MTADGAGGCGANAAEDVGGGRGTTKRTAKGMWEDGANVAQDAERRGKRLGGCGTMGASAAGDEGGDRKSVV